MTFQPWTKALEQELVHLAIKACDLATNGEARVEDFWLICSSNGRPCITRHRSHCQIVFSTYPGQKKVVNKRRCMLHLLPALRRHLVLEHLAHL